MGHRAFVLLDPRCCCAQLLVVMKLLGHLRNCLCGLAISAGLIAQSVPGNQGSETPAVKMCTDLSGANPEPCPSQAADEETTQKSPSRNRKPSKHKKRAETTANADLGSSVST